MQIANKVSQFQAECYESVFEGLMNRCFLKSLKNNIPMNNDIANECIKYSTQVLRNAGGISLLTNAIESASGTDKFVLDRILTDCVRIGTEMSRDMILGDAVRGAMEAIDDEEDDFDEDVEADDPEDSSLDEELTNLDNYSQPPEMPKEFKNKDISDIQLDTRITSKELNALKSAASKTDLDAMSELISDKVSNVLQAEKVNRYKLNEEKERLKTAIINNPNNAISDADAAESAMDRMLAIPMSNLETTVYTSLFSTLQHRAMESLLAYENVNIDVADILTEITVNNTFPIFKPLKKSFESVVDQATFMTAAMEECDDEHMKCVIEKATMFATIIYAMLEMFHTSKLNKCGPMDVKDMVLNKNVKNVAPTNDVASVINSDYKKAIENNKRAIFKSTEAADVEAIKNKLITSKINIMTAKESGLNIKDEVVNELSHLIEIADRRIADLSAPAKEGAFLDRMTNTRAADVGKLNLIASSIKYKNFDNIRFKCTESVGNMASFDVYANKGKDTVYKTRLDVVGMESVDPAKYIKYLVSKSKLNERSNIDYAVTYNSQTSSF